MNPRLLAALGSAQVSPGEIHPTGREGFRRAAQIFHEEVIPWRIVGATPAETEAETNAETEAVRVSTHKWNGILDFWPEDLVLRVGAGSTLQALEDQLAPLGLETGFAHPRPAEVSLGGMFAAGDRGLLRVPGRSLRERCLGLLAVDGRGRQLQGGGRVVKNVAGHNLVQLHWGAEGRFGIVIDLVLRVQARPPLRKWFRLGRDSAQDPREEARPLLRPASSLDPVALYAGERSFLLALECGAASMQAWLEGPGRLAEAVRCPITSDLGLDLLGAEGPPSPDSEGVREEIVERLTRTFDPAGLMQGGGHGA